VYVNQLPAFIREGEELIACRLIDRGRIFPALKEAARLHLYSPLKSDASLPCASPCESFDFVCLLC